MNIRLLPLLFTTCLATGLATLATAGALPPVSLLGDPVAPEAATRTIVITPDTKWANVQGGEIIRFVVGNQSFGWNFDNSSNVASFDLNRVAPPGLLQRRVTVYLTPDPKYMSF